ncbi:putative toxin [Alloactinosynnema sp. L-07]
MQAETYRVPDVLNDDAIGEVRNVAYQSYSSQLRSGVIYAKNRRPHI